MFRAVSFFQLYFRFSINYCLFSKTPSEFVIRDLNLNVLAVLIRRTCKSRFAQGSAHFILRFETT